MMDSDSLEAELEKKLSSLQELSKLMLTKILGININSKYLILDPSVIKPLEKVCGVKWLRSRGIERIFKIEDKPPPFESKAIFYVLYSNFTLFKRVINQIRSSVDIEKPPRNQFHIILIPQALYLFEKELEEYGLLHSCVSLHSFQWLPIHIDTGIVSLEFPFSFGSLFINQDLTYLPMFSKCLWQLLLVFGKVSFTIALGKYSSAILTQYDLLCDDKGCCDNAESDIGGLILLDRNMDYPSTLLTPGIYSALLKEIYHVTAGYCESKDVDTVSSVDSKFNPVIRKDPLLMNLDSDFDPVYSNLKNKYFSEVTVALSNITEDLKVGKEKYKDMSIDELKKYVQTQLGPMNSRKKIIVNHLIAAESIVKCLGWRFKNLCETEYNMISNTSKSNNFNFLMELNCIENNKLVSLKLFCLMLITQCLSESEINTFWEKFFHQYGFKYCYVQQNLTNAGILPDFKDKNSGNKLTNLKIPKFSMNQFYSTANRLRQIPSDRDKVDLKKPSCPSYVFQGTYIPLVTQIASMVLNSTPLEEIRTKLEGVGSLIVRNDRGYPLKVKTLLIFVVGGVTYAEIGALHFLETLTGSKIIVLSDHIISGNDIAENFLKI